MANLVELRRALRAAAMRFVEDVIGITRAHASAFGDERVESATGASKRARRRAPNLHAIADEVIGAVPPEGAAVSAIAAAIGRTPSEIAHPIAQLLAEGRLCKEGTRRGTRYFTPRPAPAEPRAPK